MSEQIMEHTQPGSYNILAIIPKLGHMTVFSRSRVSRVFILGIPLWCQLFPVFQRLYPWPLLTDDPLPEPGLKTEKPSTLLAATCTLTCWEQQHPALWPVAG